MSKTKQTKGGVLIKQAGQDLQSAVMRARDVEYMLKGVDIHPNVKAVLCKLAETQHYSNSKLTELATMFDQMINAMDGVLVVAERMKDTTEKMNRELRGEFSEDTPN